ncbi:MAG: hypothetical protein KA096_01380 [Bacteroidales bacterium]|nr:hypothetical protein [Bacteroidales bacterium]
MKQIFQKEFHKVVSSLMEAEIQTADFEQYQSVLSMVYTLIEDNKQGELDYYLRLNFPAYYNTKPPFNILESPN